MDSNLVEPIAPFFSQDGAVEQHGRSYPPLHEGDIEALIEKGRALQAALWAAGRPNRAVGEKELNFLLN